MILVAKTHGPRKRLEVYEPMRDEDKFHKLKPTSLLHFTCISFQKQVFTNYFVALKALIKH